MNTRAVVFLFCSLIRAKAEDVAVADVQAFRAAVTRAKAGTRIVLSPGNYGGGFHFANLRGEPGKPIVIAAADPKQPPIFSGAKVGMHLSKPAHVELRGLVFTKLSGNGLNIDDGGGADGRGAHHVVLEDLRVTEIGARRNEDGIKLSGVMDFRVANSTVERWGSGGGSAIDMVGCHRGVIEGNVFRHQSAPGCTGVQCKGGTSEVAILHNRFEDAGGRGVNIGGSTGLAYFRPPLKIGNEHAEARKIRVEGNWFRGGMAAIAFAGADGGVVRFNTIERPSRWAFRILQETKEPGFVPCRNGVISDNVIIFDSRKWSESGVNVGGGAAAETFKFARNWWYCADRPDRSRPKLPTVELEGVYGQDPKGAGGKAGADAWKR